MLTQKNLTAQQVAALCALSISFIFSIVFYIETQKFFLTIGTFLSMSVAGYFTMFFVIEKFVYRKIKVIYKLIYQTKATKKEEFYYKNILPQKTIEEVEEDVKEWASHTEEIELLRNNEVYRKEFLLNLSHELKTPIFAIQGYVDTLLNGALHNDDVNEKFLTNTSKNIDRLVNLVGDLDEISKLEIGEQKLFKEVFIIQELIKEIFEALSIQIESKEIKCGIKKGCELPLQVFADKEKIRQVLTNLIENAIKYGKEKGEIEASIYKIDGRKILIEISDNGGGIAEEHLPRIFERFYRTDAARARKVGGSGLGLSICKHIIEAHSETLHVRSKLNVGSTFGFTLPSGKNL